MSETNEKIVSAVLRDPVIKAVLNNPPPIEEERRIDPKIVTTPKGEVVAAPTTTEEQDRATHGQRTVNLIWETTQQRIATAVVLASLTVSMWLSIRGDTDAKTAAFVFLYGVANLVIGFYFGRTNHEKTGGTGALEKGR